MPETFLVVDGNSLVHRAFHALPRLTNSRGVMTNAAYGFTTMLLKALKEVAPALVAVAFDRGQPHRRLAAYEDYKGHRPPMAEGLAPQFALVEEILAALRVTTFGREGYEADDIIATLVKKAEERGLESFILTGDRDALQLISPLTRVMMTRKGISEVDIFDLRRLAEEYHLTPGQIPDLKGLMGDASDNIPGIPGIGEKTATQLLQQFGSLEAALEHAGEAPRQRTASLLREYAEQAALSKQLATVECDVPLDVDWEACRRREADYASLRSIFEELEFSSLLRNIEELQGARPQPPPAAGTAGFSWGSLAGKEELEDYLGQMTLAGRGAVVLVESGAGSVALGLAAPELEPAGLAVLPADLPAVAGRLIEVLGRAGIELYTHDVKDLVVRLARVGVDEAGLFSGDTLLAAYLTDPGGNNYDLSRLAGEHLGKRYKLPDDPVGEAAGRAHLIVEMGWLVEEKLAQAGMEELYRQVELPLSRVLARMELAGVAVDLEKLEAIGEELGRGMESIAGEIYTLAGETFNLNSPRKLSHILFEKLGLPAGKKTKTGLSTSAEVLEELAAEYPIAAKILDYRMLMKLKSTYIDGLKPLVNPKTGRLHTTFHQTVTATGRLSSAEPNLQNIPVRLELGRRIRQAFVPGEPGWVMLAADYSQIELRILAHITGDESLRQAFLDGEDIHARTAAEVFGVAPAEVTPEMRRRAKAVNFGIVYGITDFGLAQGLRISRSEAGEYIQKYFQRYPGVAAWVQDIVRQARENGYVTTLLGRRRYLRELFSSNYSTRKFGERTAMNTPIQGSAADLIKVAMVDIDAAMRQRGWRSHLLLQVHDELIFETPPEELPALARLARERMETAIALSVPLRVDLKYGPTWYDLQSLELETSHA